MEVPGAYMIQRSPVSVTATKTSYGGTGSSHTTGSIAVNDMIVFLCGEQLLEKF